MGFLGVRIVTVSTVATVSYRQPDVIIEAPDIPPDVRERLAARWRELIDREIWLTVTGSPYVAQGALPVSAKIQGPGTAAKSETAQAAGILAGIT